MEFTPTFFAVAVPATIFAGIAKGGFGSGAAFVSSMLLALVVDPATALAVMLPLLMMMDATALWSYWRGWDAASARLLILGGVPGVAIGAALFSVADPDVIRLLIGVVAIGFVVFQVAREATLLTLDGMPAGRLSGLFWGAVTGLTSTISHAGGPPASMFLLARGLDKSTYQSTTVAVFWAINLMKTVPYALLGVFSTATLSADLILAPLAVLGIWVGVWLHRLISERAFFRLTYALLLATGCKLVADAIL